MIKKIEHIGIVVKDLEKVIPVYRDLFKLKLTSIEESKKDNNTIKIAFFETGETNIELLESSEDEGILGDFVKKKGWGIHHIAFEVDDIHKVVRELKAKGVKVILDICNGSRGSKIAFVEINGSFVEFTQFEAGLCRTL